MAKIIERNGKQYLCEHDGIEWEYTGPSAPLVAPTAPGNAMVPPVALDRETLGDVAETLAFLYEQLQVMKGGEAAMPTMLTLRKIYAYLTKVGRRPAEPTKIPGTETALEAASVNTENTGPT
ncbi:hypothetical protein [Heliophilum fasciatum]|uniref:Uncharacterized protein n=1 Tax=Heliophilum fasciatum TaxID=35700 RepID=A0A4V2SW79_9FIRM|nr:hypothetical protein [Heliophilum fasciatum]MCW2279116.1 hypothetical protein [Heliophilum fasciatum]TCP61256.1 hypothetical protein EDD73_1299 [Heliophilum fasciatum]